MNCIRALVPEQALMPRADRRWYSVVCASQGRGLLRPIVVAHRGWGVPMLDRPFLYNIIYALAASGGRDARLFGDGFALSQEAFERSLPGSGFPELWFELPLAGRPWFDLHALASHETIGSHTTFSSHETGGYPELFSWFARQGREARQLALSWDVSSGGIAHPAVQLLVGDRVSATTCAFLEKAGRSDAVPAYRAFLDRLPNGWFACYTGVFPARPDMNLRVECIPRPEQQQAYANDPALLEAHLQQVGLPVLGDTLVERCQLLAQTPFQLEFQFDVEVDGTAGPTIGVSVRFAAPQGMGQGPEEQWCGVAPLQLSRLPQAPVA